MKTPFLQRLYLRIWLAVVGAVVLMMLLVGWLWRIEAERERAMRPGREIVLRDAGGTIIGQAPARPIRTPGQAPEFEVVMRNGQTLYIQLPRPREPGDKGPRRAGPPSARMNFAWMLALIAAAVALGSYPVVRRLTQRLEVVESGVRQWGEGELGHRLPEDGQDEVFLPMDAGLWDDGEHEIQNAITDDELGEDDTADLLAPRPAQPQKTASSGSTGWNSSWPTFRGSSRARMKAGGSASSSSAMSSAPRCSCTLSMAPPKTWWPIGRRFSQRSKPMARCWATNPGSPC